MPPLWSSRRLFWVGLTLALLGRLLLSPLLGTVLRGAPPAQDWLVVLDTVLSCSMYVGASMVGAAFVVRVLEARLPARVAVRNANDLRTDNASNDV